MPDFFKSIKITQPTPGGPLVEQVVGAVQVSTGTAADAGKLVVLNPSGVIDGSMVSGSSAAFSAITSGTNTTATMTVGSGASIVVTGTGVVEATELATTGSPVVVNTAAPPTVGQALVATSPTSATWQTVSTSTSFSAITSGTNTSATMTVGSGASIVVTGSGVVESTELATNTATPVQINLSAPAHQGQLLISQPGNATALWADPFVQGPWINGTAIVSPGAMGDGTSNIQPVFVAGYDGTNMRGFLTDSSGRQIVNVNGSVTVTGTVAVTQSTSPWVIAGTLTHNNAAPGANNIGVLPAVASSANPVYTSGDQVLLSTDLTGALRVASSGTFTPALTSDRTQTGTITNTQSITVATNGGGAVVFNILGTWTGTIVFEFSVDGTNWVSANVNPYQSGTTVTSTTGNGQWTANVGGLNSFRVRGNTVATGTATVWLEVGAGTSNAIIAMGTDASNIPHSLKLDGSQNLDVNVQSAVFSSANNSAIPANSVWIGGSDGTNLQGLRVSDSTNKELRVSIYQGGSQANISSNRLLVDPSGTTIAVTQSTSPWVTADNQLVSQGSTTSGQKGPLVQGAVSTADPTYTTAQTDPLSLTTTGHLRTQDSAEANGNGSTAPPTNAMYVGGKGADGFLHPLSTDNAGILNVNASFSGTVTPGFVTDRTQSGTLTSGGGPNQNVSISTLGAASVIFNVTGSWTGTLTFQAQLADNSWITATAYPIFTGGASVTSTTANGQWQLPIAGFQAFRVIAISAVGGTSATVNLEAGAGAFSLFVQQLSASDLNATVVQGTAGTQAQAWFVKVTDGSNPLGTSSNPFIIAGTKTNNNAAPGSNNVGVLPALANSSAPSYTDGDQVLLSVDTTGALRVSSSGTFTPALTADSTATGTITSNQNVTLSTQGTGTTLFNITGSWTGTIVFEASVDGTNFVSAKAVGKYPLSFPGVSQATANGQWAIPTGGLSKFRLRGANVTSGTATVWIEGGAGAQDMAVFSIITDPNSTNTPAVKAASTVPLATDQSLVVSLSPNSSQFATSTTANTLPGTNPQTIGTSSSAVVNATAARKEITITNTGTTIIFLGLGQTPTNTSYHIALSGCTVANDGTGSTYTSDIWKGAINAISSAGGGLLNVAELT